MTWDVDLLAEAEAELLAMPADIRARFLHISDLLAAFGPQQVGMPMSGLDGKLWEMRLTGRDGIAAHGLCGPHRAAPDGVACLHEEDAKSPARKALETAHERLRRLNDDGLATLKSRLLADPVRAEYDAQADEFAIAHELIAARARAGLTQAELAERMHTTQSTIARRERTRAAFHPHPEAFRRCRPAALLSLVRLESKAEALAA